MAGPGQKADLQHYLQLAREAVLWKLEGLSEYDLRRPLTGTGTNLLGLVKHLASVEAGYFGDTFGRPVHEPMLAFDESEPNVDMWATADESPEQIVAVYRRVQAHADATIEALELGAPGRVPWWPPPHAEVTLARVLVHVIAETSRHAGHADLVRELIDGAAGLRAASNNLPDGDARWWADHRARLQRVAEQSG